MTTKRTLTTTSILLVVILVMLSLQPIPTQTRTAEAQGIFGCPFETQRDCELLINAIENSNKLESVYIEDLSINSVLIADRNPTSLSFNAAGPTSFDNNGAIDDVDWRTSVTLNNAENPLDVRLVDGDLFFSTDTEAISPDWFAYDATEVVDPAEIDLRGIFTTLTFSQLLDVLNEIGDGVTWSRGRDITVNGTSVAVFEASFSSATLAQTSFFYEQINILLIQIADGLQLDLTPELITFLLSTITETFADQLGGIQFEAEWLVGLEDELVYGVNISGNGNIDLTLIELLIGNVGLPNQLQVDLSLNVSLSQHNEAVNINTPEASAGTAVGLLNGLFDEFFELLIVDLLQSN